MTDKQTVKPWDALMTAEMQIYQRQERLYHVAIQLGCAMARSFIHSDAGVKKWAAKSVELAKALLAELDAKEQQCEKE